MEGGKSDDTWVCVTGATGDDSKRGFASYLNHCYQAS